MLVTDLVVSVPDQAPEIVAEAGYLVFDPPFLPGWEYRIIHTMKYLGVLRIQWPMCEEVCEKVCIGATGA